MRRRSESLSKQGRRRRKRKRRRKEARTRRPYPVHVLVLPTYRRQNAREGENINYAQLLFEQIMIRF